MSVVTKQFAIVAPLTFTGAASQGFTYGTEDALTVGQIVKVPLGRRQSLGVVTATGVAKPSFATKPVTEVLDVPPLPAHLVELAGWMSSYYFASPKAVWQTLLPAGIERKRRASKPDPAPPFELKEQNQPLTTEQQTAFEAIRDGQSVSYLVQGVTGSGKTRLYLELATATLAKGQSVTVLVPEIALTPQLLALFEASFPGRVLPFHSRLSEAEKHKAWQQALAATEPMVIVGARSSLFLPVARPGLIVIDECHETSYKQEQNPRYNALTVGAKLAHLAGAKLVLGSATPGLTEVYAAEQGRIQLVKLTRRVTGQPLPKATIIDMRDRLVRGPNRFISTSLLAALKETLAAGRQSLLFINRRGSASSQICNHCGHVALCPRCELPLTFHADELKLICHICNWRATPAAVCEVCGQAELRYLGGGTKRIEAEISKLVPDARLGRLDRDSADPKHLPQLYKDLHAGHIDILIGTQMVAKGLDLPALDTVGVINADSLLYMPDFSSAERTFQLLTQVAGRSGRGNAAGRVFIQTHTPDNLTIQAAGRSDFEAFAGAELAHRRQLGYPPYRFLLKMTLAHRDSDVARSQSQAQYARLKQNPAVVVLGPAPAFHERAGGRYHWQLIAKAARRAPLLEIAASLPDTWKTDIDPINLL